ncbi:TRPM8 channel-associated factor homolog [Takifugu rubripes]|uniref:TRPM8 channel-associated factor homolog n=1 Tax=Takifugu rubripes TaxID=31033 RepID=H2TCN8_TAKRU|nr:TRPM8 channel-associated factor homolog [Takifugu rubripes]XP_011607112.2 TRPM8 channel-associated factor homolog [Takifugu rubripes]XP_011607113.2 TRPM8 channel-associated factor homolog [Takifugu rubripes]XP_029699221.1 TRPM8 channel-associated factor homolog [Takifugu rubripes]
MTTQPTQNLHEESYARLMRGVKELDLCGPSAPSDLVLIGDHAFPLAMNSQGQVIMAASLYGRGRIVVLGHEGYLTAFPDLVENAVTWLGGDGSDGSVAVHQQVKAVADNLSKSKLKVEVVGGFGLNLGAAVYVTDAYSVAADAKGLVAFMKAGGGVLIGGQAWNWAQTRPKDNVLLLFEGNKVSGVAGIYFSERAAEVERLPVPPQIPSSWMTVVIGKDFEDDLDFLLQGVSEFEIPGGLLASEVMVHGPLAFPIGTTSDGQAFLAGAYYGQGRVIVITHEGLMGRETLFQFWKNAIHWLDEGRNGVIGVGACPDSSCFNLISNWCNCVKTDFREDLSVFVCTAYNGDHLEEIQNFVAEGGGLLVGGHAWYWAQTHPGQNTMTDFVGNKLLNKMGLSLLGNIVGNGCYKPPVPKQAMKDTYNFRDLLHRVVCHMSKGEELEKKEEECLRKLGADCAAYLNRKAYDSSSYAQVVSTLTDIVKKFGIPQVCESCPVNSPRDHLLLSVGSEVYKVCQDQDALLPFLIQNNPLLPVVHNHKMRISAATEGWEDWISTGLYLSPGMKTYVAFPAELVNKGWKIQIGCHTDYLNHSELKRAACVHEQFPVTSEMMQIWNLWGGLIYLIAPRNAQVDGAEVTVQVAVPAPYYKSGVTTAGDWSRLRTAPSPWAEMEFDNIVITVPSETVRDLERPDELAALWNAIMAAIADLAALPPKLGRKERIVTDVQISHGWMHAGYPIMAFTAAAHELVSVDSMRRGMWGPIHELGHNQQRRCWELPPHTTEGTCNLWSVYVHEQVLGINRAQAHPNVSVENRKQRIEDYVKGGKNLSEWYMWTALETYLQVQERFGWDALKKAFGAYHGMSSYPDDNTGKMNLYAETVSRAVGRNLTGFFRAWGWSIEASTEEKVKNLPPWTDHPMVQYG